MMKTTDTDNIINIELKFYVKELGNILFNLVKPYKEKCFQGLVSSYYVM